jgi:heterodisulfide reductase subunit C
MAVKTVIDVGELDLRFPKVVMRQPGGEAIQKCFQCGICVASCPIREIEAQYNPRKIIKMTLLGMKDQVLKDEFIWLCSMCFMCQELCPQDVKPPEIIIAIKNLAVKAGFILPQIKKLLEVFKENGRLYPIDEIVEEEREYMELPKVIREPDFVKKILEE